MRTRKATPWWSTLQIQRLTTFRPSSSLTIISLIFYKVWSNLIRLQSYLLYIWSVLLFKWSLFESICIKYPCHYNARRNPFTFSILWQWEETLIQIIYVCVIRPTSNHTWKNRRNAMTSTFGANMKKLFPSPTAFFGASLILIIIIRYSLAYERCCSNCCSLKMYGKYM